MNTEVTSRFDLFSSCIVYKILTKPGGLAKCNPRSRPIYLSTVRCHHNAVNFHKNPHNWHPVARLWMWGAYREYKLVYLTPESLQCFMKCQVILYRVITASGYIHTISPLYLLLAVFSRDSSIHAHMASWYTISSYCSANEICRMES